LSQNTKDSKLSYGNNPKSLSHSNATGLWQTDGQMDRQTELP